MCVAVEGGCLHPPLLVAVAMVEPAAPLPSSPQLSCSLSCNPASVKVGFLSILVTAGSLMLMLLRQQKTIQKILCFVSLHQFGAKESLYIDITIPIVGVDLYHWNVSVDSFLLLTVYLVC